VPTIATVRSRWDVPSRSWIISSDVQARQLADAMTKSGVARLATSLGEHRRLLGANDEIWKTALAGLRRYRDEVECWALCREHLRQRIELCLALLAWSAPSKPPPELAQLEQVRAPACHRWRRHFENIFTPASLQVELTKRFDAEPGIVANWQTRISTTRP
jgi:hypothetical protein